MKNTRIAHLADLHLGRKYLQASNEFGTNQREADIYYVLDKTVDWLIETGKPDIVVLAGDIYDKTAPPVRAQDAAFAACSRLRAAGMEVVMIGGNHDTADATNTMSALEPLARYTGSHLALEYQTFDLHGLRLHALPYRSIAKHVDGRQPLEAFSWAEGGGDVLIAHGYMAAEHVDSIPDPVLIPRVLTRDESRWQLICLGHIHTHQQLDEAGRIFYSGALERLDWGEIAETPGLWLHDFQDQQLIQSHSHLIADIVPDFPRPMLKLRKNVEGIQLEQLAREINAELRDTPGLAGALVSLELQHVSDDIRQSNYRQIWEKTFYDRGGLHLEVHFQSQEIIELLDTELSATPEQLQDAWASYAQQQNRPDLVALGQEILEEAGEVVPA